MKLLKMFGLAAVAALMAMAFAGAGSAMAESTALCSDMPDTTDKVCTGDLITHVHETSVTKAKLLSKILNVECDVLFLGNELGTGLVTNGSVVIHGKFTYTNCGGCTVTQEPTAGGDSDESASISVLRLGHETADVTGSGEVHVECGSLIDCKYNGTGLLGTAKGPLLSGNLNGKVSISGQETHRTGGSLCPEIAKLDIETTPLTLVYIGA